MLFNSYIFLFAFLPITLGLFFLLGRRSHALAIGWLAVASLGFYAWWNPAHVSLLLASILFNYGIGVALTQCREGIRRPLLVAGVAIDLTLLGYFKYANFFLDAVGADWQLGSIVLPLGISFFTFTQIAFLVDTARGQVREVSFLRYVLFVTYFPHLIAGPVLHHKEMMPQFAQPRVIRFRANHVALGLSILVVGLLKKVLLADSIAAYASPVFEGTAQGSPVNFSEAWGGALAYTLQIYFDFSGYSDMAIGLARMNGVRLPLNFHSPYKAGNIIEFWRRWHMTLSRFLRDYLYIPLGGNRKGPARRHVNLMATMLLGGLWHGANWTFVLWGGLHGLYLMINHIWKSRFPSATPSFVARTSAGLLTFLAVVVAWVPFRAANWQASLEIWKGMAGLNGFSFVAARTAQVDLWAGVSKPVDWIEGYVWIAALLAVVWLMPNTQEIFSRYRTLGAEHARADRLPVPWLTVRWRRNVVWAVMAAIGMAVAVSFFGGPSEFIYFQF